MITKRKFEIYIWQEKHYNFTHGLGITVKAGPINEGTGKFSLKVPFWAPTTKFKG